MGQADLARARWRRGVRRRKWHGSATSRRSGCSPPRIYWEQTFPAGKTVLVEHRYKPSVGSTAGVSFGYEGSREEPWVKEYFSKYCIDDDFLRAYAKTKTPDGGDTYFENRIDYILRPLTTGQA